MNIYQKLQQCRVELQGASLKKSGLNKFAGYDYFELQDFLPHINNLFLSYGMTSIVSFTAELATLKIINTEKPDEVIEFTSPMAEANLKGCHPIQNLGAVESYQRRYLYVAALEIVEHDALDATTGKENGHSEAAATREKPGGKVAPPPIPPQTTSQQAEQMFNKPAPPKGKGEPMTEQQNGAIRAIEKSKGIPHDDVINFIGAELGKESTTELTKAEASKVIEWLNKQQKREEVA